MDTERLAEFVSTIVIIGMLAGLALPNFGVTALQDRLLLAAGLALGFGGPFAFLLVYVFDVSSGHVGPWDVEDVVFIAALAPPAAGWYWLINESGLSGVVFAVVAILGFLVCIAFAVIVRDLTVGEWPPGSSMREGGSDAPPANR